MIRGVLFDCDGVLVDSREAAERAWTRWAGHYGLDPATVLHDLHGRRSVETVARHLPEELRAEATAMIDGLEVDSAGETVAIPGARELVASLDPASYAVVTSGPRRLALARLTAAGFEAPRHLVTSEDVEHGKPDPACYLLGAARLGLDPSECVVVEDAAAGIAAARGAGVGRVVGVGDAVADLADLAVPDLRPLVGRALG